MGSALENNCPSVADSLTSTGLGGTSSCARGALLSSDGGAWHALALEDASLAREEPHHGEAVERQSPARQQPLDSQGRGSGSIK